jgi:hypothetical protein
MGDAVQARDDNEVLFFVAVKMHGRSAVWLCDRLYDSISAICLNAGDAYCDALASSSFKPHGTVRIVGPII